MTVDSVYDLFSSSNPEAAAKLSFIEPSPGLIACSTKLNEPNLRDERGGRGLYVYDQNGALESTFSWRQQFELYKIDMFVVFGIGLGYEWQTLQTWLHSDPKKEVIFLEDDLSMQAHFLEQPIAREILLHPQTSVFYVDTNSIGNRVLEIIAWNSYKKKQLFAATAYYQKTRAEDREIFEKELRTQCHHVEDTIDEFYSFGRLQFRSFFKNILLLQRSLRGDDLFGALKGIPALVVGAGPSLEANIPYLQDIQDKALIISGGSSTNALLEAGIVPHLCGAVDPNPTQYSRLKQIAPYAIPLYYQSRVIPEGLKNYPGELLYIRGGNGQTLVEWFDTAIGISGKIVDGGLSIANMNIDIAHRLGCDPVIMVGYDLSFPGGKMYPSWFKEGLSEKEKVKKDVLGSNTCMAQGNSGSKVQTKEDWLLEAEWIERYKDDHSRFRLYNTSLDGLCIENVPTLSLQEAKEKFLQETHSVSARVHRAIAQARRIPFSFKKVDKALSEIAQSIRVATQLLNEVQKGDVLAENELKEELVYKAFLHIYDRMLEKKIQMRRLFRERQLRDPEAHRLFEKQIVDEKVQFFASGLQMLSLWITDFASYATFEGCFLDENTSLRELEGNTSVPEYLR